MTEFAKDINQTPPKNLGELCDHGFGVYLQARLSIEYAKPETTEELLRYASNLVRYRMYERKDEYFDGFKKPDEQGLLEPVVGHILTHRGKYMDFKVLRKKISEEVWVRRISPDYELPDLVCELTLYTGGKELREEIRRILHASDNTQHTNSLAGDTTISEKELGAIYKLAMPTVYACARFSCEFADPKNTVELVNNTCSLIRYCAKTKFETGYYKKELPDGVFRELVGEDEKQRNNFLEKLVYVLLGGNRFEFDSIWLKLVKKGSFADYMENETQEADAAWSRQLTYDSFKNDLVPHMGGKKTKIKICNLVRNYKKK